MFNASQSWPTTSPNFFFQQKRLSLKPLSLSFSSFLTRSLHLWLKPMTSMVGALKLNTSHQHHCHDRNFMVQPIATATSHTRVALFSLSFSLSLSLSLFVFIFFCCSLIYGQKFLFLLPTCLWVWGFGFILGFNDLEKEEILIWVWGV